jgi:hypothetical protein
MNKKTIGKIQLILGIIILLIGIGGIIFFNTVYNNESYLNDEDIEMSNKINIKLHFINLATTILASSILTIVISLLFITQGLVNLSTNNK